MQLFAKFPFIMGKNVANIVNKKKNNAIPVLLISIMINTTLSLSYYYMSYKFIIAIMNTHLIFKRNKK